MVIKKVYLYQVAPRIHAGLKFMINNPPNGYEYLVPEYKFRTTILKYILNSKSIRWIYRVIVRRIVRKTTLHNKMFETKVPKGVDLVLSGGTTLDIKFPYVIHILDSLYSLGGYNYKIFMKNKKEIEEKLLSSYCKKILVANEAVMDQLREHFGRKILNKAVLTRQGVKEQPKRKTWNAKKINILFVGSIANPDDFEVKGGLETMEVFDKLSKEFDNLHLYLMSKAPDYILKKYNHLKNITYLPQRLTPEQRKQIFPNASICSSPGHVYAHMSTLEAMSYGIPLIVLDTYAIKGHLINGKNAIVLKHSKNIKGYKTPGYPCNIRDSNFHKEIHNGDPEVTERIYYAMKKLIQDKKLRERFGKYSQKLVHQKFSPKVVNKIIKKAFDESIK